jgi:hypothetical protein
MMRTLESSHPGHLDDDLATFLGRLSSDHDTDARSPFDAHADERGIMKRYEDLIDLAAGYGHRRSSGGYGKVRLVRLRLHGIPIRSIPSDALPVRIIDVTMRCDDIASGN